MRVVVVDSQRRWSRLMRFAMYAAGLLALAGCQRTTAERAAGQSAQPGGTKDRVNSISFEFQRIVVPSETQCRAGEFLVTNHFGKDASGVGLTLEYLDKANRMIGSFPWGISQSGRAWCKAGESITVVAGFNIPDDGVRVRAVVERVDFLDGTQVRPAVDSQDAGPVRGTADWVEFQFQRMVLEPSGQGRAAEFRVTNHFTKDVKRVYVLLKCLDNDKREVDSLAWPISQWGEKTRLKPEESVAQVVGYKLSDEAVSVQLVVKGVVFQDGTEVKY